MKQSMMRLEYYKAMRGFENNAASMKALLAPFHIPNVPEREDEFLLIGHVLDAIAAQEHDDFGIDPFSIMELALDLGVPA